jgi:hypothetical protein
MSRTPPWIAIVLAATLCRSALAVVSIYGTPVGAEAEFSVGRSLNWFSITNAGDSAATLTGLPPAQFGPSGSLLFPASSGFVVYSVGLLEDGTRLGRLYSSSLGMRLAFWPSGASEPVIAQTLGQATNGSTYASATAHNRQGDAVGYASRYINGSAAGGFRPVKWSRNGTITELGILATDGSQPDTRAERITSTGHIIGFGRANVGSDFRPIRWLPGSTQAVELETFAPLASGQNRRGDVNAVNNAGTAVGASRFFADTSTTFGFDRAVRWANGGAEMTPLFGLSSSKPSVAYGVNERGDSVGQATPDAGAPRAVLWPAGQTQPIALEGFTGVPATGSGDRAYAVNSAQSAVGYAALWNAGNFVGVRAALWLNGSTSLTDLNTLLPANSGWTLEEAGAITETGFIRGTGNFDPDGPGGTASHDRSWTLFVPQAGTYGRGDANFDTKTDFADLVILAQKYNLANPSQDVNVADFDLNGTTDFQDLIVLAQNYSSGVANIDGLGSAGFAAEWALAQSLVPEPGTGLALLAGLIAIGRPARRTPAA